MFNVERLMSSLVVFHDDVIYVVSDNDLDTHDNFVLILLS